MAHELGHIVLHTGKKTTKGHLRFVAKKEGPHTALQFTLYGGLCLFQFNDGPWAFSRLSYFDKTVSL